MMKNRSCINAAMVKCAFLQLDLKDVLFGLFIYLQSTQIASLDSYLPALGGRNLTFNNY